MNRQSTTAREAAFVGTRGDSPPPLVAKHRDEPSARNARIAIRPAFALTHGVRWQSIPDADALQETIFAEWDDVLV